MARTAIGVYVSMSPTIGEAGKQHLKTPTITAQQGDVMAVCKPLATLPRFATVPCRLGTGRCAERPLTCAWSPTRMMSLLASISSKDE